MAEMPAGVAADLAEGLTTGATTPSKGRQSPRPSSIGNRKDTILSLVELLLQQEETRERGAYPSYPVSISAQMILSNLGGNHSNFEDDKDVRKWLIMKSILRDKLYESCSATVDEHLQVVGAEAFHKFQR
jgi:hypothetical protein